MFLPGDQIDTPPPFYLRISFAAAILPSQDGAEEPSLWLQPPERELSSMARAMEMQWVIHGGSSGGAAVLSDTYVLTIPSV